ncbi:MAG: hypothetical protein LAO79_14675 [Acidobacteriia bacterium]|nr:hypothetical protein [Terriglobia bacterium]
MSATRLYRIAAVLFVLFAAAHTFGFLRFKPPTEEGMAVLNAMNTVHFAGFSYGGFYVGFGLYVSVYMIFSAFLAWHLSNVATLYPQSIGALGWIFFGIQIASLVLSWKYFSSGPAMFSAMVALFLGWAAAKTGSRVST